MEVIARLDALPVGSTTSFLYRGRPAILIHDEDGVRAFVNICTHEGGCCAYTVLPYDPTDFRAQLATDAPGGTPMLQCDLHGARFNPRTGKALSSPAPLDSRLTAIPVHVDEHGIISVDA